MSFIPLNDQVLVRHLEAEKRTKGGILIPDTAEKRDVRGAVIAVGRGRVLDSGVRIEPQVKAGDVVNLNAHSLQHEVEVGGEKLFVVHEYDVLGIRSE